MAAGKKKSEEKGTGPRGIERMLRDNAEEQQASSPKRSPDLSGKTPEELTHELRVHQVELEIQAEELRQSKIALAESRDKYLDLYEFAPLGYLSLNDKARITEVNLSGAALLGIERNKLIKAPFSKFMLEKDSDQWHRYFLTVLKQEEKQSCTLMIQRSDGSAFPARLESIRLTGSDGATTVRIAFSDISDIWQIEALKESEERFDQLAEQSNTITWEVDPHGLYTYVSHVSMAVWGYRPDELVGQMHFYDLHPQSGREASKAAAFKIFEQKEPFTDLENAIQSRDGREVWVSTNGIPLLNADGTLRGYRGSDTDITERKQAEERLKQSEILLRSMIESPQSIIIFSLDRNYRYLAFNASHQVTIKAIWGVDIRPGTNMLEVIGYERDRKKAQQNFDRALSGEYFMLTEEYGDEALGRMTWENTYSPVYDNEHQVIGLTVYVIDVTERKQAEEALKESEERFDQLAEQSNTITWEVDPHGLYTYVSHVSTAVWGYRPDELVGRMHFYDLHAGPGREASKAAAFKIFEQKKPFKDLENAIQSRDGGVVWVSTNGIPLLNANGTLRGYRGSDTDITERKVAEEALNDNYLFMQTLIQTIPIPVFIKNRDGKYTGCNNTFETFFGQSRGEIIGKTVYDVAPKEIADEYFRTDEELINHPGTQHYEWRAVSKNGQTRDVIIDKATIMNSDGCATGIVGVMFDITERKVAEEEIKRQAALISSLLDSIPDIIFFKDIAGIYLGCNPPFAEFVGKSREEIVGRTDYDLFDKEIADFFRGHDKRMLELGEPRHNEEWITYPDGRKILIDTLKTPYWGPDETLVGILGISRDVTGRKRAENAVSEANKKLNILNSITRHDVLNQISVLVMTLELVGESVQGAEVLDYVKKAEGATERITRQIDFTREYQDIGVLEPTWQNVSDIIANEKEQLTTCPYDIRVDLGAIEIYADPLLPKVFYNLLENAVRHGEHVSTVRFSSRESEHGLTPVCEDDGAGVDAESKKHLFQQGFGKHTGFGLYLMREILGITDITIKETGEPGNGARFEMVVPGGMWRRNEMVRDGQVNNP